MKYQILPLTETNLAQIMEIERGVYEYPWSASQMKDSILSAHTESWGITDVNNNVVSFVIVSALFDEAEILTFAVAKNHQGKGLGQKLLSFIINNLSNKNITKLFLEVHSNNEVAISIYSKYGFKQISVRKNYYRSADKNIDALVMQADI